MYDILGIAATISDANTSLRRLFPDYEEQAQEPRKALRIIMERENIDNPLKALMIALQRLVNKYGEGTQTTQVHSLWFCAAAADICQEKGGEE